MILTNNPIIDKECGVRKVEGTQMDVLLEARDLIHKGYSLVTSPLAASGRMHLSPVRSIVLSDEGGAVDPESIRMIEASLESLRKHLSLHEIDFKNIKDYSIIDRELLSEALKEIERLKN